MQPVRDFRQLCGAVSEGPRRGRHGHRYGYCAGWGTESSDLADEVIPGGGWTPSAFESRVGNGADAPTLFGYHLAHQRKNGCVARVAEGARQELCLIGQRPDRLTEGGELRS